MRLALFALFVHVGLMTDAQQYAFTQFTPREGLAQSQVRCMAQDAQGYLWFGTLGGASRFDGHAFTNYALQEGLPEAQVNAMLAAHDGTFWLAAGSSLARFDGQHMRTVPMPKSASNSRVLALAENADGDLFIATEGAGVFRKRQDRFAPLEGSRSDTIANVRALLALPDGSLLIGARNGLFKWKDGSYTTIALGGTTESVSALAQGKNSDLWIGTFGGGVFRIDANGSVNTAWCRTTHAHCWLTNAAGCGSAANSA
jgi:ligand-binding sensor domain-containing protein